MAIANNAAVCLALSLVIAATFMAQPQPAAARCRKKAHSSPSPPAAAAEAGGGTAHSSPSSPAAAAEAEDGGTAADASPAALEFLRERCNPGIRIMEEKYVSYCYASLLPHAGSFNGSRLRVVGAAVEVLVANFRFLLAELRRLESTSGGGAYNLSECIDLAKMMSGDEAAGGKQAEELARIRSLAAAGDDGAVDENGLLDMEMWLDDDVGYPYDRCVANVETIPDVETVLPTMALVENAMETCFGLLSGFFPQPPQE